MATTLKKTKLVEVDRLSGLPDNLILQILSFLDTKIAVQTCVLSHRWKSLWTSLPSLNFNCQSFRSLTSFKNFVREFFFKREHSNLYSLKFHFHSYTSDKSFINKILRYALSHSVQKIVTDCGKFLMNQGVISHVSVIRILHLQSCEISSDLLSACVNLETLILNGGNVHDRRLKVSAPRLVTLDISLNLDVLVVSCPRLSCFIYKGSCTTTFSLEGCPVLDRINMCLHIPFSSERCLKNLFQEVILRTKLLVVRENGLTVLKTVLSKDDVRATISNEATDEGEELLCHAGIKEEFEVFLGSAFERVCSLRSATQKKIQLQYRVQNMKAKVADFEQKWQWLITLTASGVNLPPMPSRRPPVFIGGKTLSCTLEETFIQLKKEVKELENEVNELEVKAADNNRRLKWLIQQLKSSGVKLYPKPRCTSW